ncbi:unnamed protein product [Adineta steineri]|uniref:Uncharacterized protein n=1 Tax=Adineta steineri TaxID=433720 RepID=A0A813S548_9BILA|nr:unnamed protein product [Adineta steineri]
MASRSSGICIVIFDEEEKLTISIFNTIIEPIELFRDLSSCISFVKQQIKEDKVVVLITTSILENILQSFELLTSIEAILILLTDNQNINVLPSKVIGIYSQIDMLLISLSDILTTIEQQLNLKSLLFNYQTNGNDNLDFYFYNLWKKDTEDLKSTKKSLVDQAHLFLPLNDQIKSFINDFKTSYKSNQIITWLDKQRHPFPYYLLISNAMRIHDQEILLLTRFFFNELTKQIKPIPLESNDNQVYLGTKLPIDLIDRLEKYDSTGSIAFQCFLPATRSRACAVFEATQASRGSKTANVLFKIDINNLLGITLGETLLIDIALPFRICSISRGANTNDGHQLLTIIKLTALNQNERDQLFEQFIDRQEKLGRTTVDVLKRIRLNISDDEALADEYIARGEWSEARNIFTRIINPNVRVLNKYGCLLREHFDNILDALNCHQQALSKATNRDKAETLIYLGLVYDNMKEYNDAFQVYSQALQWFENEKKRDPVMIARCLIGLGNVQWSRRELNEALHLTERALVIREKEIKPRNDFDIATCLSNMGNILHDKGDIQRALLYTTRAVDLLSTCGKDDARFAAVLNNLGAIYQTSGNLIKAREYFERALELLPGKNHSYRESTLNNIARLDIIEQLKKCQ